MLLLLPYTEYLRRIVEPRNIADIVFVFLLVYAVLKLLRGTRAAPMAAGIAVLVFLYWLSIKQDLATLEFVLSNGLLYIGIAIIVLFQSEIRQALITFGNRFRMPFSRHRGQFGEGVYDEVVLAATTLASTKTGALNCYRTKRWFEKCNRWWRAIRCGTQLRFVVEYFQSSKSASRRRGCGATSSHCCSFMFLAADSQSATFKRSRYASSRCDGRYGRH